MFFCPTKTLHYEGINHNYRNILTWSNLNTKGRLSVPYAGCGRTSPQLFKANCCLKGQATFVPKMDIFETRDEVVYIFEMPGINANQLEVTSEGRNIVINAPILTIDPQECSYRYQERPKDDEAGCFSCSRCRFRKGKGRIQKRFAGTTFHENCRKYLQGGEFMFIRLNKAISGPLSSIQNFSTF